MGGDGPGLPGKGLFSSDPPPFPGQPTLSDDLAQLRRAVRKLVRAALDSLGLGR